MTERAIDLAGEAICVLDLETLYSAEDCGRCGQPEGAHSAGWVCDAFARLGWDNKRGLGLSIGCYWDYEDMALHWFDGTTLAMTVTGFVARKPLLVSFNGIAFDFALMRALLREDPLYGPLCDLFKADCATSYDLLATIWQTDPARKRERGLNNLDALSRANGYGVKSMDGALAPQRWRAGHWAEVISYNVGDVLKTKDLFEQIVTRGYLLRGDGLPLYLPGPERLNLTANGV